MRTLPILFVSVALAVHAPAKEAPAQENLVECTLYEDGGSAGPSRLKTAIIEMRAPSGQSVDLVGAIHIADQAYYDDLNARFEGYDSVLYELVTNEKPGTPPREPSPKKEDDGATSAIRFFQVLLKNALGLTYQTEVIDYTPAHFIHADMSLREFNASMEAKGESMQSIFENAFRAQMTMAADDPEAAADLSSLFTLFSGGDNSQLKRDLGGIMVSSVEVLSEAFESEGESTLLGARNAVAVSKLLEILGGTSPPEEVAVFYGAAHLPGMVDLLEKAGFAHKSTEWLTAWEIPVPEPESGDPPSGTGADAP
jgi:hypothetical protein